MEMMNGVSEIVDADINVNIIICSPRPAQVTRTVSTYCVFMSHIITCITEKKTLIFLRTTAVFYQNIKITPVNYLIFESGLTQRWLEADIILVKYGTQEYLFKVLHYAQCTLELRITNHLFDVTALEQKIQSGYS